MNKPTVWKRKQRQVAVLFFGVLWISGFSLVAGEERSGTVPEGDIWIWGGDPASGEIAKALRERGLPGARVSRESVLRIAEKAPRALLFVPGKKAPPEARPAIDAFRRNGGSLIVLDPGALDYRRVLRSPVSLADLSDEEAYSIRRPGSSRVNPEPVVEVDPVFAPGGGAGLSVSTKLIGDGDVMVQVPLREHRDPGRDMIGFQAKGDHDVRILSLWLEDEEGRRWVAFVELDFDWGPYEVPTADFLLADPEADGSEQVDPGKIRTLSVGMVSRVLWPEVFGRFSVADLVLGEATEYSGIRTGEVGQWRVQYEALGIPFPAWAWDPFLGTEKIGRKVELGFAMERWDEGAAGMSSSPSARPQGRAHEEKIRKEPAEGDARLKPQRGENSPAQGNALGSAEDKKQALKGRDGPGRPRVGVASGPVWTAPLPPHERGRERTELEDILVRDEWTKRALLTANGGDRERVVGKWIRRHGGGYAGSELVLAGLPNEKFSGGSPFGSFVADAVALVAERPKIVRVMPVLTEWDAERRGLICRVEVHNPSAHELRASVAVDLGDGRAEGDEEITVPAGEAAAVDVLLPDIAPDFPCNRFGWRVTLESEGNTLDVFEDRIDAEQFLRTAAEYMVDLQTQHSDGRFSHHFFADHYAARFLLPYSRALDKQGETDIAARYAAAALRFADMIADRQRDDGSFPMGYGEHRDIIFVADLGQICLGLVHLASWLDPKDPRRKNYLNTVRRYLPFRQSFRQTPELVGELEAKYGPDPARIREGFYGIGLLGSDYFDGGRWEGIRPEYRGRWWVTPVSMGFLGALARFEDDAAAHEIGREDLRIYLDDDFGVTAASYFHVESLFWMFDGIEDEVLREKACRRLAAELPPKVFAGKESLPFEFQGRASLWWLSLLYFHRYFAERPEFRAAFVKGLWLLGSDSSSHSVANVIGKYPQTTYGPSIGAFRYVTFSAFWISELLDEGRTLLRDRPFSTEAAERVHARSSTVP